jgi:pimeloyl-ACP methyl ester carboxylesterase
MCHAFSWWPLCRCGGQSQAANIGVICGWKRFSFVVIVFPLLGNLGQTRRYVAIMVTSSVRPNYNLGMSEAEVDASIGGIAAHGLIAGGAAINPVELCTVRKPLVPCTEFSPGDPPEKTNSISYFAPCNGRKIPFKFIRAGRQRRPVLIFLHGMGLTTASYWGLLPFTLPSHDVLLIDWSDFSTQEHWPRRGMPLERLAADWLAVPAALGIDRFVLAGSSLGGGLSLMTAIDHPSRVTGLILFNPAAYPQALPRFYKIVRIPLLGELIMRTIKPGHIAEGIVNTGYANPRAAHPDLVKNYDLNVRPLANRLKLMHLIRALPTRPARIAHFLAKHICQPTLVIWGVKDRLLDGSTPHRLKDDIPGVQLELIDGISHLPHEETPEQVGPMLANFLRRQAGASQADV